MGLITPILFFDTIVIAVNYPKPIYFLAEEMLLKPLVTKFLTACIASHTDL
jgi:hypothetical protein